jgi:UDP-N-acetylglucosamine 2-epimerase (hydrolysing)
MNSKNLPHIDIVKKRYNIKFDDYGIAILHPFKFNEKKKYIQKINIFLKTLKSSDKNYIIIYPNNDKGNDEIIKIYKKHSKITNFKLIRSMRFEYFLTLLKNSDFIIGNSSVGVREAPFYSIPSINIGERQKNRFLYSSILNVKFDYLKLLRLIKKINKEKYIKSNYFGNGKSDKKILSILKNSNIWKTPHQKQLIIKSIK